MESHAAIAIKITNVYSLLLSNFIISKNYLRNKLHLKRNVFEVITVTVFKLYTNKLLGTYSPLGQRNAMLL